MRYCFTKQLNTNDCGIACLSMIFKYYNIDVGYDSIKKEAKCDREGVSAYEIIRLSLKHSLVAEAYKDVDIDNIKQPFIAHVISEDNVQHFVVVYKVSEKNVLVADPSFGIRNVPKTIFLKRFTRVGITFRRNEGLQIKNAYSTKSTIKITLITLLWASLSIIYSYNISFIIYSLSSKYKYSFIYYILLIFLFIGILKETIFYLRSKLTLSFRLLVDKKLSIPMLNKILSLPNKFYQTHPSGELISKVNDLSYIKEMISKTVEIYFVNITLIICLLIVFLIIKPLLLIVIIIFSLITYLINKKYYKKHDYINYDVQIKNEGLNNTIISCLSNILTIKSFVKERYFISKVHDKYNKLHNTYNSLYSSYLIKEALLGFTYIIYDISIIACSLYMKIGINNLIFIAFLSNMLIGALNEIYGLYSTKLDYNACKKRINELFKYENVSLSETNFKIKSIKLNKYSFKYNNKFVLKNVNLQINNTDWIMVTGSTGSGKSTLFKIISKQIITNKAGVYYNNKSIQNVLYKDVKNNITYVDQKSRLFSDTIKNNICLDNKYYEKAAKTALVDKILKKNNITYDYKIDSINDNLSGGDMQKILIAQALCNANNILILDETTSQLDKDTEKKILTNIKNNYKHLGLILISHNGTNKNLFDKIVKIENGKLKEMEVRWRS